MKNDEIQILQTEAIGLLKRLICIPSFSKQEDKTASVIEEFLLNKNIIVNRLRNNIWAKNKFFDSVKPSILLNSHHDTVKPNPQYTKDPFSPLEENGKLFGLGSNDAGGSLVSLLAAFSYFYHKESLTYNLVLAATAEEEVSGNNGIELLLNDPDFISQTGGTFQPPFANGYSCGIVGEPTLMDLAIAEKSLMVLDCVASGKAGHAARDEGDNALYKAMNDIAWIRKYSFPKTSEWLGPVKMSVTVAETENKEHNIVPSVCRFVVDIRINEIYTHEEILNVIKNNVSCEITPRNMRINSSIIPEDHPLLLAGLKLGKKIYGSPTGSDKSFMPFPALKTGPGDSARSHTADEYIYIDEIRNGVDLYIQLLNHLV